MISKSEERRNQILVGAFKLFLVKEYANVTTADFEIVGLSKDLCYDRMSPLLAGSLIIYGGTAHEFKGAEYYTEGILDIDVLVRKSNHCA